MAGFDRLLTTTTCSMPAPIASSMMSWIAGVSPIGSSSLGTAFVTGRKRVPAPAAGITALLTCIVPTLTGDPLHAHRTLAGRFRGDADVRLQVPRHRRDDRGPAVVQRSHAHGGRASAHRPHDAGE